MIKSALPFILIAAMQTFYSCSDNPPTSDQGQMIRLAKLVIDSTQLESYTQIREDLKISLIDLHDFQRIASTVRSKPLCVDYTKLR